MFRVLAFTMKPDDSADTRYRILQYVDIAKRQDIQVDHRSLMGARYFKWQVKNQQLLFRVLLYPFMMAIRLWQILFLAPKYDAVWLLREMAPFGPPFLEQLLVKRAKRLIFDVDDALHVADPKGSRLIPVLLRDVDKFKRMANTYSAVVCGNRFLADYYSRWARNVFVVPTVVEVERYATVRPIASNVVRIGWIGTPLNRYHLELVRSALHALRAERNFEFVVVGVNEPLAWELTNIRYLEWRLEDELTYFSHFDIGIMPLADSAFARGKCAFKLIQYMAAGLPAVASPVGANSDVIVNGENGFLAGNEEHWKSALKLLIDDAELRRRMGESGRKMVQRYYSLQSAWSVYAGILTGEDKKEAACAGA